MTLTQLEELFMAHVTHSRSESTALQYKKRLKLFRHYCQDKMIIEPAQLSPQSIGNFARHIGRQDLSSNSKYVYLDAAKRFLSFLEDHNYLFLPLSHSIRLPQWQRHKKTTFTPKQIQSLINKVDHPTITHIRNKLIVALAFAEQLRTGDIYNLSVIDVDLEAQELRITRQKRFCKMKTTTLTLLKDYLKNRHQLQPKVDWLLINQFGQRLQVQNISKVIRDVLRS